MTTKPIHVSEEIHRRVKVAATLSDQSIKDWVESALTDALNGEPSASVLVDEKESYETEATE